jgi:hypothetical protein
MPKAGITGTHSLINGNVRLTAQIQGASATAAISAGVL